MLTPEEQLLLAIEVRKILKRKKDVTLPMLIAYWRDCADYLEDLSLDSQNH